MSIARLGVRDVFFEMHGASGEHVVLMHSLGGDHSTFAEHARALSRRYRVLTFDMRGHGRSTLDAQTPSLDVLADDVMGLLSHLEISRAHLVGQSIGGMIALAFASRYRDWAGSFAVVAGAASSDALWDRRYAERADLVEQQGIDGIAMEIATASFGETTRRRRPDLVASWARTLKRADRRGYAWSCRAMIGFDLRSALANIACPVLVVSGAEDVLTGERHAREISETVPRSRLETIAECGHLPFLEQPRDVTKLLDAWLGSAP
jgi:3-oxoadipate enol-lactonase